MPDGGANACIPGYGATGRLGPAVGRLMGGRSPALVAIGTAGSTGLTGNEGVDGSDGT